MMMVWEVVDKQIVKGGNRMKHCNKCGHEYYDEDRYCHRDGSKLIDTHRRCVDCDTIIEKGYKFCPNCGMKLHIKKGMVE